MVPVARFGIKAGAERGRFQDHDESAHYEYVWKSAGVPVHYCTEPFNGDQGAVGGILKCLKRTMAAEYSRELSVKVKKGLRRLVRLPITMAGLDKNGTNFFMGPRAPQTTAPTTTDFQRAPVFKPTFMLAIKPLDSGSVSVTVVNNSGWIHPIHPLPL